MQGKRRQDLVEEAEKFITEYDAEVEEKNTKVQTGQAKEGEEDAEWTSKTAKYKRCRMVQHVLSSASQ